MSRLNKQMKFEPLRCDGCSKELGIICEFDMEGTYIFCSQPCVDATIAKRHPHEPTKPSTEPPIYIKGIHYD